MKKIILRNSVFLQSIAAIVLSFYFSISGFAQNAGINAGGAAPDPASGLDVNFSSKGLLIPRIALSSSTSFAPLTAHVAGMIIYNTASTGDVTPGFYIDNGTKWIAAMPKAVSSGDLMYWDGSSWIPITAGQPGQLLQLNGSGIPVWTGAGYAVMTTTPISGLSATAATSGGNISSDAGNAVTARGVCWAITPNPTTAGSKTIDGAGTGTFTSNLTGLTTGTVYYLRAYATNGNGTSYGNLVIFTTP